MALLESHNLRPVEKKSSFYKTAEKINSTKLKNLSKNACFFILLLFFINFYSWQTPRAKWKSSWERKTINQCKYMWILGNVFRFQLINWFSEII